MWSSLRKKTITIIEYALMYLKVWDKIFEKKILLSFREILFMKESPKVIF